MGRRKGPRFPEAVLDKLLAGADPKTAFDPHGLIDELKKALAERSANVACCSGLLMGTNFASGLDEAGHGLQQRARWEAACPAIADGSVAWRRYMAKGPS